MFLCVNLHTLTQQNCALVTQERCTSFILFILHNYIFTAPIVHNSWHYGKARNVYHVHVGTIKNANRKFWVYLQYVLPPSPTTPPKHMQPFFPLMPPPPPPPPSLSLSPTHTHKLHSLPHSVLCFWIVFKSCQHKKCFEKNCVTIQPTAVFDHTYQQRRVQCITLEWLDRLNAMWNCCHFAHSMHTI